MMIGKDGESQEPDKDGKVGEGVGEDEGGAAKEGNEDHLKEDQKRAY